MFLLYDAFGVFSIFYFFFFFSLLVHNENKYIRQRHASNHGNAVAVSPEEKRKSLRHKNVSSLEK